MSKDRKQLRALRVVLLADSGVLSARQLRSLAEAGASCVYVSSGYQAAAELLAEPCDALVADLDLLDEAGRGLAELARRRNAQLLAYGSLPTGWQDSDLQDVHVISSDNLATQLRRIIRAAAKSADAPPAELVPAKTDASRSPQADALSASEGASWISLAPRDGDGHALARPADEPFVRAARAFLEPRGVSVVKLLGRPPTTSQPELGSYVAETDTESPPTLSHLGGLTPEQLDDLLDSEL
ncbi:MAG: hypothetical protein ACYS8X_08415 [Planctomycetota bacterium]